MSGGAIALIVVLLILGSPIWLGLGGVLIALVVGFFGVLFGIAAAFVAAAVGMVAGGVGCVWGSATASALAPGLRFLGVGGWLISAGLGLLATALCVWLVAKIVPSLFRWIVELCRKPFHRKKGGES